MRLGATASGRTRRSWINGSGIRLEKRTRARARISALLAIEALPDIQNEDDATRLERRRAHCSRCHVKRACGDDDHRLGRRPASELALFQTLRDKGSVQLNVSARRARDSLTVGMLISVPAEIESGRHDGGPVSVLVGIRRLEMRNSCIFAVYGPPSPSAERSRTNRGLCLYLACCRLVLHTMQAR